MVPFLQFSKWCWAEIREGRMGELKASTGSAGEVGALAGRLWNTYTDEQKRPFVAHEYEAHVEEGECAPHAAQVKASASAGAPLFVWVSFGYRR